MRTFLPGIGFRRAGTRLSTPVSVRQGDRTLTVLRLVATPEATDLVYEITHLPNDEGTFPTPGRHGNDRVTLSDGANEYGQGGAMHIAVRQGKLVRTFTMVPLPAGTTRVTLNVSGPSIGAWSVPLDLAPFPRADDARYVPVDAGDTQHGILVRVRGMTMTASETALDLSALPDRADVQVRGLGGLGMRDATTALLLRDDGGRTYVEHFRQDARDQFPDPTGIADVAIFDVLSDEATTLVLEVPTICFTDPQPRLDLDLPVATPVVAEFAGRQIRVLSSRETTVARGPNAPVPAVAIDVDFGTTDDDICVIHPFQVSLDGQMSGYGFGGKGIYGPAPQPLSTIEIVRRGDEPPHVVTFIGATLRARGPWRIKIARPR